MPHGGWSTGRMSARHFVGNRLAEGKYICFLSREAGGRCKAWKQKAGEGLGAQTWQICPDKGVVRAICCPTIGRILIFGKNTPCVSQVHSLVKKESLESLRKCIVANRYLSQNKIIIKERFGTHTPPSLRAARTEQGVEEAVGWPRRRTVGARW